MKSLQIASRRNNLRQCGANSGPIVRKRWCQMGGVRQKGRWRCQRPLRHSCRSRRCLRAPIFRWTWQDLRWRTHRPRIGTRRARIKNEISRQRSSESRRSSPIKPQNLRITLRIRSIDLRRKRAPRWTRACSSIRPSKTRGNSSKVAIPAQSQRRIIRDSITSSEIPTSRFKRTAKFCTSKKLSETTV